jgi:hypothetical protein
MHTASAASTCATLRAASARPMESMRRARCWCARTDSSHGGRARWSAIRSLTRLLVELLMKI